MLTYFDGLSQQSTPSARPVAVGVITRVVGLTLEARGVNVPIGTRCLVGSAGSQGVETEVVGFDGARTFLMPLAPVDRLSPRSSGSVAISRSRGSPARPCTSRVSPPPLLSTRSPRPRPRGSP